MHPVQETSLLIPAANALNEPRAVATSWHRTLGASAPFGSYPPGVSCLVESTCSGAPGAASLVSFANANVPRTPLRNATKVKTSTTPGREPRPRMVTSQSSESPTLQPRPSATDAGRPLR